MKFASDAQRKAVMAKLRAHAAEEKKGAREYDALAKHFQPGSMTQMTIGQMADDERRHASNLGQIHSYLGTDNGKRILAGKAKKPHGRGIEGIVPDARGPIPSWHGHRRGDWVTIPGTGEKAMIIKIQFTKGRDASTREPRKSYDAQIVTEKGEMGWIHLENEDWTQKLDKTDPPKGKTQTPEQAEKEYEKQLEASYRKAVQKHGSNSLIAYRHKTNLANFRRGGKTTKGKAYALRFSECEHSGDAESYMRDIQNSGGQIIEYPDIDPDSETCRIRVEVSDKDSFLKKFRATQSVDFCNNVRS